MSTLNFSKSRENTNVVYNLSGRLDTQSAPDLQDDLDISFSESEKDYENKINLTLDFNGVEYMSSAGLRTVLYTKKKIDTMNNSTLEIINVKPEVMEVFNMTGFTDFLNLKSSEN